MDESLFDRALARQVLTVRVEKPSSDVAVVVPAGDIDLVSAPLLLECAVPELTGRGHLVVDLTEVAFLASRGVQALLELDDTARLHGCEVHLAGTPNRAVTRLLKIIGLGCAGEPAGDIAAHLAGRSPS
ncbi:MAG TPA: STAS domain-containing protein [Pseudonocardia sp.]|nr:STAS domain-containing protein [Pseudonocardia sp.]